MFIVIYLFIFMLSLNQFYLLNKNKIDLLKRI